MSLKNFVSIIIPTCNRYDVALKSITEIKKQKHRKYEIILCDDSDKNYYLEKFHLYEKKLNAYKVKHIYCAKFDYLGNKDYGLARSRNHGILESKGEFLIFLDDRFTFDNENVIELFIKELENNYQKIWIFGNKGCYNTLDANANVIQINEPKKTFVENFSCIRRNHIISAGMFCERIDKYGGMTEELTIRLSKQGFKFKFVSDIKARQIFVSDGWNKKLSQIDEMKKTLYKLYRR